MNEMDGLVATTEAIVIMTTNRPDVIEPALASRPGRVSQALHFPLPDTELRKQLIRRFFGPADISNIDLEKWVERTNGSSPAFLEEFAKRSLIFAAERTMESSDTGIQLVDEDLDNAIHELIILGGELTAGTLGFPVTDADQSML